MNGQNGLSVANIIVTTLLVAIIVGGTIYFVASFFDLPGGDPMAENGDVEEVVEENTACTLDSRICPDGSTVGRVSPSCEFAQCPLSEAIECTPEQNSGEVCVAVYQPVCGNVNVQCVTEPCPLVQRFFSSPCEACQNPLVESYVFGECAE